MPDKETEKRRRKLAEQGFIFDGVKFYYTTDPFTISEYLKSDNLTKKKKRQESDNYYPWF